MMERILRKPKEEAKTLEVGNTTFTLERYPLEHGASTWVHTVAHWAGNKVEQKISMLNSGDIKWESKTTSPEKGFHLFHKKVEAGITMTQEGGFKEFKSSEALWKPAVFFNKFQELQDALKKKEMQEWVKSQNEALGIRRAEFKSRRLGEEMAIGEVKVSRSSFSGNILEGKRIDEYGNTVAAKLVVLKYGKLGWDEWINDKKGENLKNQIAEFDLELNPTRTAFDAVPPYLSHYNPERWGVEIREFLKNPEAWSWYAGMLKKDDLVPKIKQQSL